MMKKLVLLPFLVLFSLTVFSSNNDIPGEESIKKECQQESTIEKEKSFDLAEKNAELKNLNEVSIETEVKEEQKEDRQCGGSYTEGISKVDFIEYVPDLRLWVA